MEVNNTVIVVLIIAILIFVYFIIKRNKKDQKNLEDELNQNDIKPDKHDEEHV